MDRRMVTLAPATPDYFEQKYGTATPEFTIEGEDWEVFGQGWSDMPGNPACLLYKKRSAAGGIPPGGKVYYGKIGHLGELVHESEIPEEASAA